MKLTAVGLFFEKSRPKLLTFKLMFARIKEDCKKLQSLFKKIRLSTNCWMECGKRLHVLNHTRLATPCFESYIEKNSMFHSSNQLEFFVSIEVGIGCWFNSFCDLIDPKTCEHCRTTIKVDRPSGRI